MRNTVLFVLGVLVGILILASVGCTGPRGSKGVAGAIGGGCTVTAVSGGSLITCADGTSSFVSNGSDGQDGEDGEDGTDATIGVVSLCNKPTSYPLVFTEVAFCIGSNLYAVYSQNDGFLTLVPPGNYSSNGHNSSCTFTVQPNCVVSH